jgi:hypothetical protein
MTEFSPGPDGRALTLVQCLRAYTLDAETLQNSIRSCRAGSTLPSD